MVRDLIASAILGLDFLQPHSLVLDFSEQIVRVYPKGKQLPVEHQQLKQIVDDAQNSKPHVGIIAALSTLDFGAPTTYELPENCGGDFRELVEEHKTLLWYCTWADHT